jgi:hypothetical protein
MTPFDWQFPYPSQVQTAVAGGPADCRAAGASRRGERSLHHCLSRFCHLANREPR